MRVSGVSTHSSGPTIDSSACSRRASPNSACAKSFGRSRVRTGGAKYAYSRPASSRVRRAELECPRRDIRCCRQTRTACARRSLVRSSSSRIVTSSSRRSTSAVASASAAHFERPCRAQPLARLDDARIDADRRVVDEDAIVDAPDVDTPRVAARRSSPRLSADRAGCRHPWQSDSACRAAARPAASACPPAQTATALTVPSPPPATTASGCSSSASRTAAEMSHGSASSSNARVDAGVAKQLLDLFAQARAPRRRRSPGSARSRSSQLVSPFDSARAG